jgi:alpha-L-fucosidase 2
MYPILKGSVEFFMEFLVEHPNGKWLVTNPSTSPENFPASPGNKPYFDEVTAGYREGTTICAGSSIDMQILSDLFGDYIKAASILKIDTEFGQRVSNARSRLVPPQIGRNGSLQEWTDDWDQLEKEHRHFSHLYGLYPGNVISAKRTPALANAAKKVLEQRGDGGTGWSRGWKMALWARLYDGDRANLVFKGYLKEQCYPQLFAKCFTPMQVDGTFGVGAGITEMILQSHEEAIHLLPALPAEWNEGEMKGVCARGAFELSLQWRNGKPSLVQIISKAGKVCRVLTTQKVSVVSDGKKVKIRLKGGNIVEFETEKDKLYHLQFKP